MSKELLPALEQIKSTIDSTKEQTYLSSTNRTKALEHELDQLEQINSTIDNVIQSMDATASHVDVVLSTTGSTNKLLDLWIKILSQTSYTTELLNEKNWKGVTHQEEEYASQLGKFEELNRKYTIEKQKREQEKEQKRQKKQALDQRAREREEALRRRVYGSSGTFPTRGSTVARRASTGSRGSSRGRGASNGLAKK